MKDNSVEHKLKLLYSLQQVDSQLREVLELKGDLPSIVAELDAKTSELKAKIKELNDFIKKSKVDRDSADVEIIDLGEKIEKYKSQQLQVKSNKQYDALTKEIESAEERTTLLEKTMSETEGKMVLAKSDIDTLTVQLDESQEELDEKKKELREVNKEHEKEELKLQHERDKLLSRIDKTDLDRYERIKNAKNGKAVVAIRRNACGGCFNRIPPQKLLELRQNQKFFMCEHCGRILVSDQVVEMSTTLS
jgi:predicted  nucleic acid-binding Zn-ribbon protein